MGLNSYAVYNFGPLLEKFVPSGGTIAHGAPHLDIHIALQPFDYKGQHVETELYLTGIELPGEGPEIWTGQEFEFPPEASPQGHIELGHLHTPVGLNRIRFGIWREPFIEATFELNLVFRVDGPWYRDVPLTLQTVFEYQLDDAQHSSSIAEPQRVFPI